MAQRAIKVDGLSQLVRDLGKADKDLRRATQKELSAIAKIVSDRAGHDAASRFGGRAGRFIRPRVRGASAYAESRARSKGIRPNFGTLIMGVLLKARSAKYDEATRRLERMLDNLLNGLEH